MRSGVRSRRSRLSGAQGGREHFYLVMPPKRPWIKPRRPDWVGRRQRQQQLRNLGPWRRIPGEVVWQSNLSEAARRRHQAARAAAGLDEPGVPEAFQPGSAAASSVAVCPTCGRPL